MTRENQRNETSILYLDGRENSGDHQHYFNLPYLDVLCFPAVVVSTFFCGSVWQRCAVFMSKQKTRQVCRGVFRRELSTVIGSQNCRIYCILLGPDSWIKFFYIPFENRQEIQFPTLTFSNFHYKQCYQEWSAISTAILEAPRTPLIALCRLTPGPQNSF